MTFRPIDRVAEQHYFFRRRLADALTQYHFTEERSAFASDCSNYEEYWRKTKSDRFFDMSTLVRAGAAVEEMLKSEYVRRKGYASRLSLQNDPRYQLGVFQRTTPPGVSTLLAMFRDVGVELASFPEWQTIQQLMIDRHLYAHSLGLIDEKYLDQVLQVAGRDLREEASIGGVYPAEDVYWFEPLSRISQYIECVRRLDCWLADA